MPIHRGRRQLFTTHTRDRQLYTTHNTTDLHIDATLPQLLTDSLRVVQAVGLQHACRRPASSQPLLLYAQVQHVVQGRLGRRASAVT